VVCVASKRLKPEARVGKIEQIEDGISYRYHRRKDGSVVVHTICCDCCLVHLEEYTVNKRYLTVKVWRDDEATAKLRKRYKRTVLRDNA